MTIRSTAGFFLLIAAAVALTPGPYAHSAAGDDPWITLTSVTVNGKTIKGTGKYSLGKKSWKSITLFARNKDSGQIFPATTTTKPGGDVWPETNQTLDNTVATKGDYKVWAVLTVLEADGKTEAYYGSTLKDATVTEGDAAGKNYIAWAAGSPTASDGTIVGEGTFDSGGVTVNRIELWVAPSAGGQFRLAVANRDAATNKWGPVSISALNPGTEYNVFAIYTFTSGGNPFQYAPSIEAKTP